MFLFTNMNFLKVLLLSIFIHGSLAWFNDPGRIRLEDVKAITLHDGQWTTGRRNPGVPQLKCIGGSAVSADAKPKVVQCRNVGSDGFDAQWECKADMDDAYRFGKIQVSCEGYDHPNDPYILKGSCGLEYTIEYTEKGRSHSSNSYHHHYHHYEKRSCRGFWWKFLLIIAFVVFIIRKTRLRQVISDRFSSHFRRGHPDTSSHRPNSNAPPTAPGYKDNNERQNASPPSYEDATSTADEDESTTPRDEAASSTRPGFWNGFGWGGLFGYLFGSRNNRVWPSYGSYQNSWWPSSHHNSWWPNYGYSHGYNAGYHNGWTSGWGSRSWGSSSSSWFGSSSSNTRSRSSSSRTTSGFGGTSRR